MRANDQFRPPISLMHVHGSPPGQVRSYTYCTNIDEPGVRLELLAALNADFVAPDGVEWGTYEPVYEETFRATPVTGENIGAIHDQLVDIIVRVSLPLVSPRYRETMRATVRAQFDRIGLDIGMRSEELW